MELVTTSSILLKKIEKIQNSAEFVCIDTEFVREKTYYPTLGLVQIATLDDVFAIDPIDSNIDMQPLKELLLNENIIKVFHACSQDLEIFYNLFAVTPKNLFDTQAGAKFLGFGESISYGKLVEHYLRITLDKSHRFTDWTKRPLDQEQLDYAALDVVHLRTVFTDMRTELTNKGRYDWAVEESLKFLDEKLYKVEIDEVWKKLKVKSSDRAFLALVKSLARWREVTAQNLNKPRAWILKDDAIQEIAAVKPKTPKDLQGLRFFRYEERLVSDILGVVDYGLTQERSPKPEPKRSLPDSASSLLMLLKIVLKAQCYRHDIAPSVIADSDDLDNIALGNFRESKAMQGWRYEVFGKYAEKLYHGKLAITAEEGKITLIEPSYD
jgi:ribonuclease D